MKHAINQLKLQLDITKNNAQVAEKENRQNDLSFLEEVIHDYEQAIALLENSTGESEDAT